MSKLFFKLSSKVFLCLMLACSSFLVVAQCPDVTYSVIPTATGFAAQATPSSTATAFFSNATVFLKFPVGTSLAGVTFGPGAFGGTWSPTLYSAPGCSPSNDYVAVVGTNISTGSFVAGTPATLFEVNFGPTPPCLGVIGVVDLSDPFVTATGTCAGLPVSNRSPALAFFSPTAGPCTLTPAAAGGPVSCDLFAPLPVELLSFTATKQDRHAALAWQTASELNNKGFTVQRSIDGVRWTDLGWVNGNGITNSTSTYAFVDESPLDGGNYYRLAQLDYDGKVDFSDIRSLVFGSGPKALALFPNPTIGRFVLDMPSYRGGEVHIRATDATGRVVFQQQSVDFSNTRMDFDFSEFAPGVYQFNVRYPLGEETIPLMIMRN